MWTLLPQTLVFGSLNTNSLGTPSTCPENARGKMLPFLVQHIQGHFTSSPWEFPTHPWDFHPKAHLVEAMRTRVCVVWCVSACAWVWCVHVWCVVCAVFVWLRVVCVSVMWCVRVCVMWCVHGWGWGVYIREKKRDIACGVGWSCRDTGEELEGRERGMNLIQTCYTHV